LVPPTLTPYGAIALPLPADMLDQSAASYSEEGSDLMVGAALENFSGSVAGAVSAVSNALSGAGIDAANKLATKIGDIELAADGIDVGNDKPQTRGQGFVVAAEALDRVIVALRHLAHAHESGDDHEGGDDKREDGCALQHHGARL
jgi:hypothetical protein